MKHKVISIITNKKGRRILILREALVIDKISELSFDDFDAIYLNIRYNSRHELKYVLREISPFTSNKAWIKPRFTRLGDNLRIPGIEYLVDGISDNPLDDVITERIEEICNNIQNMKIPYINQNLHMHIHLCLRLVNYCFVRGFLEFTTTVEPLLSQGFSTLFSMLFANPELNTRTAMFQFIDKLEDLKYIEYVKHIDKIHICSNCNSTRLLFIETCPKCNSSDIHRESVIHHFRCANVSPESTYEFDGQLRCPKCKQYVRHIGVDYDRPAELFTCKACKNVFLNSKMKVYCTDCGKVTDPSGLTPYNIELFRFTKEGLANIPSLDVTFLFSKDIWNGYNTFDMYLKQLRYYAQLGRGAVIVIRFRINEPGLSHYELENFTQDFDLAFYKYCLTKKGAYFYISHRCEIDNIEFSEAKMEAELSTVSALLHKYKNDVSYTDNKGFTYKPGDNIEHFILKLETIDSIAPPHR